MLCLNLAFPKDLSKSIATLFQIPEDYFANLSMRYAPRATITKTIASITKSGYPELSQLTYSPSMITSFDVKIILACICASLLLFFCNR